MNNKLSFVSINTVLLIISFEVLMNEPNFNSVSLHKFHLNPSV